MIPYYAISNLLLEFRALAPLIFFSLHIKMKFKITGNFSFFL